MEKEKEKKRLYLLECDSNRHLEETMTKISQSGKLCVIKHVLFCPVSDPCSRLHQTLCFYRGFWARFFHQLSLPLQS